MARNQTNLVILDESALVELLASYAWRVRKRICERDGRTVVIADAWAQEFAREKFAEREGASR